jgi:RpiR family transcriptional regulator, carbohydrate utilization regulator
MSIGFSTGSSSRQNDATLLERIQEHYGTLRPSERIVADFLRSHAGERLDSSITQLGRQLGVSEATISRVSRALGYEGYPDMKLSLAQSSSAMRASAFPNLPRGLSETDTIIATSAKLANALGHSITETQRLLDADRIDRAVSAIEKSQKTVFVGVGGAASICQEAVHMFIKAGIEAESHADGYTQTIVAATMNPQRVMVGISHTGYTETVAEAMRMARRRGSPTIAITSDPKSPVADAADTVLATWHHSGNEIPLYGDFLEGRICQLFLIDLIYLSLVFRSGERAKSNLDATAAALAEHYRRSNS